MFNNELKELYSEIDACKEAISAQKSMIHGLLHDFVDEYTRISLIGKKIKVVCKPSIVTNSSYIGFYEGLCFSRFDKIGLVVSYMNKDGKRSLRNKKIDLADVVSIETI